jgi:integrase
VPRPPLELETWGKIRRATIDGKPTAVTRYRDSDGVTRVIQRQGRTPAEAERNLIRALKRRLAPAGEDLTRDSTVKQLAAAWLPIMKSSDRAGATIRRYTDLADRVIAASLGSVRLGELTVPRVDRFLERARATHGDSTTRTVRSVLLQMLDYAVRQGAIERNPADAAQTITAKKKAEVALRKEDVWAIRDLLLARDAGTDKQGRRRYTRISDVADMYMGTGARTNEVLALTWDDIRFDTQPPTVSLSKTLVVDDDGKLAVQPKPKTDDSIRDVRLPPSVVDMLMRRRVDAMYDLVFPSSTGTPQWDNNLMRQWSEALKGTPYAKVTPTKFRKAVATLLAEEVGADAAAAQLGHGDVAVTKKHYIKHTTQGPDAAREHLEAFFQRTNSAA